MTYYKGKGPSRNSLSGSEYGNAAAIEDLLKKVAALEKRCCCKVLGTTDGAPVAAPVGNETTIRVDPATLIFYSWNGSDWISSGSSGPLMYVSTLAQTGANPPVPTVSRNDFTGVSWARASDGSYSILNTNNEFVQGRTIVYLPGHTEAGPSGGSQWHTWVNANEIAVLTGVPDGSILIDDVLGTNSNGNGTPFVIEVWPAP